jgi:hypothetical protein
MTQHSGRINYIIINAFLPLGFRISDYKYKNNKKLNFFLSPTLFFLYPFPPLTYLFHPSYLPSIFIFLDVPFSPSLSFRYIHIPHELNCLFLLIAHSAPFLSFYPIPIFSLLVPTSKSRHHFSFFCSLSPQVPPQFPLLYTSHSFCCTWILSFLSFLSVSLSVSLSSTYIHLPFALIFPLFPFL